MEVLGALRQMFRKIPGSGIGICLSGKKIMVAHLERDRDRWRLSDVDALEYPAEEEADEAQAVAELVRMHCARNGWDSGCLAVSLPERMLFVGKADLPDLGAKELAEAVHWEVEGSEFFGEREFRAGFMKMEGDAGGYWMAAVEEEEAGRWAREWEDQERVLLTVMPPLEESLQWDANGMFFAETELALGEHVSAASCPSGSLPAIYAAMLAVDLLPEEYAVAFTAMEPAETWAWKRLSLAVACSSLLFLCSMAGWDVWRLHEAKEAQMATHHQRMLLGKEEKKKTLIERSVLETRKRDSRLECLSKERFPWQGLLVHFGSMTVEGVYISDMFLSERNLLNVEGEAVSFDALAEFLKGFEADRDFFPNGPVLQNSSVSEKKMPGDLVHFSLQMEL